MKIRSKRRTTLIIFGFVIAALVGFDMTISFKVTNNEDFHKIVNLKHNPGLTTDKHFEIKADRAAAEEDRHNPKVASNKPIITICTCTHSLKSWKSLADTSLQTLLIPSIERTVTEQELKDWDVRLYLGIDHDDAFWLQHHESFQHPEWLTIDRGFYEVPEHKVPFNEMMKHAYDDGAEYMVRINDDTEFVTKGWITMGVEALRAFEPPSVGVVGPTCKQGNTAIMTHDMVHRTHLEIFDHYYPTVFSAWWIDDWITKVYEPSRSIQLKEWEVKHHTGKHGTRYTAQRHEQKLLAEEVAKGKERVAEWVEEVPAVVLTAPPTVRVEEWVPPQWPSDSVIAFGGDSLTEQLFKEVMSTLPDAQWVSGAPSVNTRETLHASLRDHTPYRVFHSALLNTTFQLWSVHFRRNYPNSGGSLAVSGGILLRSLDIMFDVANIVILNYGVHWLKADQVAYEEALRSTIPLLQTFNANGGIGLLRETLPQHFKSLDGSGDYEQSTGTGCGPLTAKGGGWRNQLLHQITEEFGFNGVVPQFDVLRSKWNWHTDCTHYKKGMGLALAELKPFLAPTPRLPICLGILAYQGVKTLDNTLASYARVGLFDIVEETHILFQQIDSPERRAWVDDVVARYPQLRPTYSETNTGFAAFPTFVVNACESETVLVLEEDFSISNTIDTVGVKAQLQNAVWLLWNGVEAVRLRSRKDPGEPNHSHLTWLSKGSIESSHLISHVFWDDNAEDHVPEISVCRAEPKTWCASSANAHYTNNPTMYKTAFAKTLYDAVPIDQRASNLESWLTTYWRQQEFTVAYSDAVFTHNRLDRTLGNIIAPLTTVTEAPVGPDFFLPEGKNRPYTATVLQQSATMKCRGEASAWREAHNVPEDKRCSLVLSDLNEWSSNTGIPYGLFAGTLLGWWRQCSCIPHSTDVDVIVAYTDVKGKLSELSALGTVLWIDKDQNYPRIVKVSRFGMHLDVKISYRSAWLDMNWILDGDESTILAVWDLRESVTADLHGVQIRVPSKEVEIQQRIWELYGDEWASPPKHSWEHVPKDASKKLRMEIFGMNNIIDVLDAQTRTIESSVEWVDDPLRALLTGHGLCLQSTERTRCINRHYAGTRGGASKALVIPSQPEISKRWTHAVQHLPRPSTTVVIAAALNYGITEFTNFVVPLRRVYDGYVVLFVNDDLPADVIVLCTSHNITTRPLPTGSRLGVKGNRYIGYSEVCRDYDWCFATDFRDVFFQADPFASPREGYDLVLAEEFASVTIKTCPYNSKWIKTCWGEPFLVDIGDNTPICSGTIMGTPHGFEVLMTAMLSEMEATSQTKGCSARDQGHLNYLYFANKLSVPVLVEPRGTGIVNTIGYITPRSTIGDFLNPNGLVKNTDGSVSSVVHQYDRFPEMKALVVRLSTTANPKEQSTYLDNDFITEDDLQDQVCDFSFRTRRRNDLKRGTQLRAPSVICAMGDKKTLQAFFETIVPTIEHNFTLVTVEHDDAVPQHLSWLDTSRLQAWYGWNIGFVHPKLHALPIGLNKGRHLANVMQTRHRSAPKNGRVLVNFKLDRDERRSVWEQSRSWGALVDRVPYDQSKGTSSTGTVGSVTGSEYYAMLAEYSYVVCPQGLGTDTHRLWEALYLGAVPIVLKSSISALFEDLPVIQLDRWSDFSAESLHKVRYFVGDGLRLSTWVQRIHHSITV